MKKFKLLALLLPFTLIVASMPTVAFAAEQRAYAALYNEKISYIDSLSEDNYSLDCVLFSLAPSAIAKKIKVNAKLLGLDSEYLVEEIYTSADFIFDNDKPDVTICSVQIPNRSKEDAAGVLAKLESSALVESCALNIRGSVESVTPNDELYENQKTMPHDMCRSNKAWAYTTGSSSIVVAVLDTGIKMDHPDLAQNIWTNSEEVANDGIDNDNNGFVDDVHGWDFVDNDNNPADDNGHGTHVSGIIGAVGNNNIGVSGICWNVKMVPLKIANADGYLCMDKVLEALEYIGNQGITITNFSGGWFQAHLIETYETYVSAINSYPGLLVVASGNTFDNIDASPNDACYPSCFPCDNIISVANLTDRNALRGDSNYGVISVDLAAPGTGIVSTYTTFDEEYSGYYKKASGTSMAAPCVTGAAVLIKSLNPNASIADIKNAILENVDIKTALDGKVLTGGSLNVIKALKHFITTGDADLSGIVDVSDVMQIRNHIMSPCLTGNAFLSADVNTDGVVDADDMAEVRNIIMQTASNL